MDTVGTEDLSSWKEHPDQGRLRAQLLEPFGQQLMGETSPANFQNQHVL